MSQDVLVGAWGERAGELLARAIDGTAGGDGEGSVHRTGSVHRAGSLTMPAGPQILTDDWCAWLLGEPRDRGRLAARYGLGPERDLPGAFARALAELGIEACELLSGRYVVVALERDRDRCLIARDQLGAQPLVYTRAGTGILFAEHERDLLRLLPSTPGPDRTALLQWIDSGFTPAGQTLYEGISRLPAGHRLILGNGRIDAERWWHLRCADVVPGGDTELTERVREAAFAAIGRAAAGARRPAVKLSGGLDSACVAAGLAVSSVADGRALALGGSFAGYSEADESELIESTARHTHLPLELVPFDDRASILAPALAHIDRWRLPPATPNLFLWQPLMARARELDVDTMLDGEGGDELFGVATYLIGDMLRAGRLPTAWSLTGRVPGIDRHPGTRVRLRVLRRYGLSPLQPGLVKRRREARRIATARSSLIPRTDALALSELRLATEADRRDGPVWWRMQAESMIDLCDLLDMSAHFRREAADEGIDRRHPFLHDLELIELVLRLPPRAQFDPVRDRLLLRDALDGLIPEQVRTRHAKGHFTPLVLAGIRSEEANLLEPLWRAEAPVRAYVCAQALDRKLAVAPNERAMLGTSTLWQVAIANTWLAHLAEGRS